MTSSAVFRRVNGERGAVLIYVAIALVALLAFTGLVVDYGLMWVSRRQAQNAADAGALAGAVSLAYVAPTDLDRARAAAVAMARTNLVWGQPPAVEDSDVFIEPCPPGSPGLPDNCIRVNVYRNQERGNALPTFFTRLVGVVSQGVRATATAQILSGNATECLKPWAVADKWAEHWPVEADWTTESIFDKYTKSGGGLVPDPSITRPDVYIAPTADSPGTGFAPFNADGTPTSDFGLPFTLKIGSAHDRLSSGWFLAVDLENPECSNPTGGDCYRTNIKGCSGTVYKIGDTLAIDSEQGNMIGPTAQGVEGGGPSDGVPALIQQDPGARWDTATHSIVNSCAPGVCADGRYHSESPRIVPIPLFDVDAFYAGTPNGKNTITITNIMGFFIEGMGGQGNRDVVGYLVAVPGLKRAGGGVTNESSFLRTVILVR